MLLLPLARPRVNTNPLSRSTPPLDESCRRNTPRGQYLTATARLLDVLVVRGGDVMDASKVVSLATWSTCPRQGVCSAGRELERGGGGKPGAAFL